MKLNLSKEWYEKAAQLENGQDITAISPELLKIMNSTTAQNIAIELLNLRGSQLNDDIYLLNVQEIVDKHLGTERKAANDYVEALSDELTGIERHDLPILCMKYEKLIKK